MWEKTMENKLKIVVAGTGYVGLVTAVCLSEVGHQVTCVDQDQTKIALMSSGISPIYEPGLEDLMIKNKGRLLFTSDYANAYRDADVIFIAVGTPEQEDGSANLTYVRNVSHQIAQSLTKDCVIVVKSTVPIGTNDEVEDFINENLNPGIRIHVASNPEFLSQGSAVKDTLFAKRIVIGTEDETSRSVLEAVYRPFNQPFVFTNRRSAEMIKYASNDFLALKISYINEIANFCEMIGANIEDVTYGMSFDPRIGDKFLSPGIGFGGSCFPKDTKALYHLASKEYGYELLTIKAAIDVNNRQKTKMFFEAKKRLGSFSGLNIAILGLTFKPKTDDIREAASIENVRMLLKNGARVTVYDPVGEKNFRKLFSDEVIYASTIEEAIRDKDAALIMTEWDEIRDFKLNTYKELMKNALIFDGRNCYKPNEAKEAGLEYYSIGR